MKKISFRRNEEADVLGLPMYLIIIMIVAVAVIAAVIFMMPKGNQTMDAHVIEGQIKGEPTVEADTQIATFDPFEVKVLVTTKGEYNDPIIGASVRIGGYQGYGGDVTDNDGIATITVSNAQLPAGVNKGYLEMTVKASGYEDVVDGQAVMLIR